MDEITKRLFELQDKEYFEFHKKLIPTVAEEKIIGVRTPMLRKLAKELAKREDINIFLKELPHRYYEEDNLHGFILEQNKEFDNLIVEINRFLPFIDNWATCDMIRPKIFQKHKKELLPYIDEWMASNQTYVVRFGIEMLMSLYLDADFEVVYLEKVCRIKSEEYYVNMMIAWFFATALAKQWDSTIPYLENKRLQPETHNKTIQKARESYRITKEQKIYLSTLKRKHDKD